MSKHEQGCSTVLGSMSFYKRSYEGLYMQNIYRSSQLHEYLELIGVAELPPLTSVFDPGYDHLTLEGHLQQSAYLMDTLKISMACWLIANENITRRKIQAARQYNVPTVVGGGPFEIAIAQNSLEAYLDLCAHIGVTGIECATGFTEIELSPTNIVKMAHERGLSVQFELGKKHEGPFTQQHVEEAISAGKRWLHAGATRLIIEARESGQAIGLFDYAGTLNTTFADAFAQAFGLDQITFEAPTKASQFALLSHFGKQVRISNVRLEELLRVEIFRRGLHSDAFALPQLRPQTR